MLHIEGRMRHALQEERDLVHLPEDIRNKRRQYFKMLDSLRRGGGGKEPTEREVAEHLGMSQEHFDAFKRKLHIGHSFVSVHDLIENEERHSVEMLFDLEDKMISAERRERLLAAIPRFVRRRFSPRFERVFRMYYPIFSTLQVERSHTPNIKGSENRNGEKEEATSESIAQEMGVTRSRIDQMLARVIRAIQTRIYNVGLERFIAEELGEIKISEYERGQEKHG